MGYAFDVGPNCSHNVFHNYLASSNQKAARFYIGGDILDWPLEAQCGLTYEHEMCARECFLLLLLAFVV